eukprot:767798-Hanusia_phi.AAC.3
MDIDSEHLGIPDTEYKATVKMSAAEFQRIMRDLSTIGDTVSISCTKEAVKFSVEGDIGQGNVIMRHNAAVDKVPAPSSSRGCPDVLCRRMRPLSSSWRSPSRSPSLSDT